MKSIHHRDLPHRDFAFPSLAFSLSHSDPHGALSFLPAPAFLPALRPTPTPAVAHTVPVPVSVPSPLTPPALTPPTYQHNHAISLVTCLLSIMTVTCFLWLSYFGLFPASLAWSQTSSSGSLLSSSLAPDTLFTVGDIKVSGNVRISLETILSKLSLRREGKTSLRSLDDEIKRLYATGYFQDVKITVDRDTVVITVIENPLVNYAVIEGNKSIPSNALLINLNIRPGTVYSQEKAQRDASSIIQTYQQSGRYAVSVSPKVILLERNRVNVVYEVTEGAESSIRTISFVGNRLITDNILKDAIASREDRWFRFLSNSIKFDPNRNKVDRQLLLRYYQDAGFAEVNVYPPIVEISGDGLEFFITFRINENPRYRFGELKVTENLEDLSEEDFLAIIGSAQRYSWYNKSWIENAAADITELLGVRGYPFVDINIDESYREEGGESFVDINFSLEASSSVVGIEAINVEGNFKTQDRVIRRFLRIREGDAFNAKLLRQSVESLRATGYFNNVGVETTPGAKRDTADVTVTVEEKETGGLQFGGGYSTTEGALLRLTYNDTNLLGTGRSAKIASTFGLTSASLSGNYTIPNFRDTSSNFNVGANFRRFSESNTRKYSGNSFTYYASVSDRFTRNVQQSWTFAFSYTSINAVEGSSDSLKKIAGDYYLSSITQTLTLDRRDNPQKPKSGYIIRGSATGEGIPFGSSHFLRLSASATSYFSLSNDFTIMLRLVGQQIVAGDGANVPQIYRQVIGGYRFYGFDSIGPRNITFDENPGGLSSITARIGVEFGLGLPKEYGITGVTFIDVGTLTNVGEVLPNVVDTGSVRVGTSIGISWVTSFAPIHIIFSRPLAWETSDPPLYFLFGFGLPL